MKKRENKDLRYLYSGFFHNYDMYSPADMGCFINDDDERKLGFIYLRDELDSIQVVKVRQVNWYYRSYTIYGDCNNGRGLEFIPYDLNNYETTRINKRPGFDVTKKQAIEIYNRLYEVK